MNLSKSFHDFRLYCKQFVARLRWRRIADRAGAAYPASRAFVMVQIDALSLATLQEALAQGALPHLARLLRQGRYRLTGWRCGLPSCTTAIQAGLFYGAREAPGFRWYDKARGGPVTSHRPDQMRVLEETLRARNPGLLKGGGVHTSLLSGDADHALFTVSRIFGRHLLGYLEGTGVLLSFLARPGRVMRLLYYTLSRFWRRLWADLRRFQIALWPLPLSRPFFEALVDATFTEFMTFGVLLDLYRGVPRLYANYNGYDEVAHTHGVLHAEALWVLRWIDSRLAEIEKLAHEGTCSGYDVFILSDHGMAPAIPFSERYGQTLGAFIAETVHLDVGFDPGSADAAAARILRTRYLAAALRDSQTRLPPWGRRLLRVTRRPLLNYLSSQEPTYNWELEGEVVVQVSGPLAHVYFRVTPRPMELPEVALLYAEFMQHLVGHDGIELVAGRDGDQVVILGRKGGVLTAAADKVAWQGSDPLAAFRDHDYVLRELRHLLQLPTSGDLVLLGRLLDTGQVVTFEEQRATHGGLGGGQDEPFLIYPASLVGPPLDIASPEALYHWFAAHYPL